jgi:hypothetical protein
MHMMSSSHIAEGFLPGVGCRLAVVLLVSLLPCCDGEAQRSEPGPVDYALAEEALEVAREYQEGGVIGENWPAAIARLAAGDIPAEPFLFSAQCIETPDGWINAYLVWLQNEREFVSPDRLQVAPADGGASEMRDFPIFRDPRTVGGPAPYLWVHNFHIEVVEGEELLGRERESDTWGNRLVLGCPRGMLEKGLKLRIEDKYRGLSNWAPLTYIRADEDLLEHGAEATAARVRAEDPGGEHPGDGLESAGPGGAAGPPDLTGDE